MNAIVYGYFNFDNNGAENDESQLSKEQIAALKLKRLQRGSITAENGAVPLLVNWGGGGGESKNVLVTKEKLLEERKQFIGRKCQTFYTADPFIVSRACMQYVFDEAGNRFLDCISNVQHVGHCHPDVVRAIASQSALSTCNIRFVSPLLGECAKALLATLPPQMDTIFFCNSGSEANDLALQLARDWTGANEAIVLENAYHGHITTAMQMSPYKFERGANIQRPKWVHVAPAPDVYRGKYRLSDTELQFPEALDTAGQRYAKDVRLLIEQIEKAEKEENLMGGEKKQFLAAFVAEALQSCGGQVLPPPGYFQAVAAAVREHGGLVVIDEVQTGFGRVGDAFWAHQLGNKEGDEEFVPDILTFGKPMGNGYPVAAVLTRREIADKFCGGAEYFNTYGGNPVACAATLAVLEVLEREKLVEHSKEMGILFRKELESLKSRHLCIGDIRGVGMFWGVDLVKSRSTREPAPELAEQLILKLRRERGVLLNADGPFGNVLKFKPPLCFNEDDLHFVVGALDDCLEELSWREEKEENENENEGNVNGISNIM